MGSTTPPRAGPGTLWPSDPQAEILRFFESYGEDEPAQEASEAGFDNQIKSLSLSLAAAIADSEHGTVVDVGCGKGIILRRLRDIGVFQERASWRYVGVGFLEEVSPILHLAVELGLHRRAEALGIEQLRSTESRNPC